MRTTVTLDADVVRLVRSAMHRSQTSFKRALNGAIRTGLAPRRPACAGARFVLRARPMGLRCGIDPSGLNKLADELEAEAAAGRMARAPKP